VSVIYFQLSGRPAHCGHVVIPPPARRRPDQTSELGHHRGTPSRHAWTGQNTPPEISPASPTRPAQATSATSLGE
jgi:hypothetical protein